MEQQQENIMTKKETIKQLMLLHEEFEKTRPTFTEQHLKLANYIRTAARMAQFHNKQKRTLEQKPSIIKRIVQFLGFGDH